MIQIICQMEYAFCTASVAPLRKEPSHRSEMVSQLLLGETGKVISVENDFVAIESTYDGYVGWIQKKQIVIQSFLPKQDGYFLNAIQDLFFNHSSCRVSIGTPYYNDKIILDKTQISYPFIQEHLLGYTEKNILTLLEHYMHTPYLWGGKSCFGIDCSGLTQQVFKIMGIWLPRDAYQQIELGEEVAFISEAKTGDLAFFDNGEGKIIHVGVMVNNINIIHASGTVRLDKIDMGGIIHGETGERTHKLRIVKRMKGY